MNTAAVSAAPKRAPAAPGVPEAPEASWPPKVWKRGQVGIGTGEQWLPLQGGTPVVGTEFGRGRLELVATMGRDLFFEDTNDAIRAASYLSTGQQGAIVIDHANFIGAELRTVDVGSDGHSQLPNERPAPYRFEELASTAQGRAELERTLKLDREQVIVDGRFLAVADLAGSVTIHEALKYLDAREPRSSD